MSEQWMSRGTVTGCLQSLHFDWLSFIVEEEWEGADWHSVQRLLVADSVTTTARCYCVHLSTRLQGSAAVQNVSQCKSTSSNLLFCHYVATLCCLVCL